MGSLLSCLAKAGKNIPRDYRDAILARAKELRDGGAGSQAAALQAIDERLAEVRAMLAKAEPASAAPASTPSPAQKPVEGDMERDAEGHRIFKQGERVVIGRKTDDSMNGRHGVISDVNAMRWTTVMYSPSEPGRSPQTSPPNYYYTVKTDAGASMTALRGDELTPETGAAPEVAPDIEIEKGRWDTPVQVLARIGYARQRLRTSEGKLARARTDDSKRAHRGDIAQHKGDVERLQKLYDAWKVANPGEEIPALAQAAPAATAAPGKPGRFTLIKTSNGRTGKDLWVVKMNDRVERDEYDRINAVVRRNGGMWSKFTKGFEFHSEGGATDFMQAMGAQQAAQVAGAATAPQSPAAGLAPNEVHRPPYVYRREPNGTWTWRVGIHGPTAAVNQLKADAPIIEGLERELAARTEAQPTESQAEQDFGSSWDASDYGTRQEIAQRVYPNQRTVVHRISGAKWASLSDGERRQLFEARTQPQGKKERWESYQVVPAPREGRFIVGELRGDGTMQNLAEFGLSSTTGRPTGIQHFFESKSTRDPVEQAIRAWSERRIAEERVRTNPMTGRPQPPVSPTAAAIIAAPSLEPHDIDAAISGTTTQAVADAAEEAGVDPAALTQAVAAVATGQAPVPLAERVLSTLAADPEARAWITNPTNTSGAVETVLRAKARQLAVDLAGDDLQAADDLIAWWSGGGESAPLSLLDEVSQRAGLAVPPQSWDNGARPELESPKEAVDDPAPAASTQPVDSPVDARLPSRGVQKPDRQRPPSAESAADRRADDGGVRGAREPADGAVDGREGLGNRRGAGPVPDGSPDAVVRGSERVPGADYYPGLGGLTREGSWFEAARRNLDIIDLARKIDDEKRAATPQEQEQLAKYVGFGAGEIRNNMLPVPTDWLKKNNPDRLIFPESVYDKRWKGLAERAAALPLEWQRTILQSTQYAHYTSERMVRSIWDALRHLGFTGGRVFEPGMGIGHFRMLMPQDVAKTSHYTGVEFDAPTALVAKLLSPKQVVLHDDFIKRKFPDDFYDLAVGNPPFSKTKVLADPRYLRLGLMLHDFFFAKSLDKVRPGGLLAFVTSKGTMDKKDSRARKYMADRADFLGAIRLPSVAFKDNAGTSVVTDVVFLRKRSEGEQPGGLPWMDLKTVETKDGPVVINEYFADHPEMVLGQNRISGNTDDAGRRINSNGLGGEKYTVVSYDQTPEELDAKFAVAVRRLPGNVYSPMRQAPKQLVREVAKMDLNPDSRREGVVYVKDGRILRVEDGVGKALGEVVKLSDRDTAWLTDYVGLRGLVQLARSAQFEDGDWQAALAKLNKAYDAFVKKHGPINTFRTQTRTSTDADGNEQRTLTRIFTNRRLFGEDYDAALVTQLETIDEDGNIEKAPFLKGRTIGRPTTRDVKTIGDALAVSLDENGRLDLDDVGSRLGVSRDEAIEALGDQVYRAPDGQWQLADEYLSGNVVAKLAEAETAALTDAAMRRNVEALRQVQPNPLGPGQISVKLGAPWVPDSVVTEFAKEIGAGAVSFSPTTESWQVEGANMRSGRSAADDYGTANRSPSEILEAVLNSRQIKVQKTVAREGGEGTKTVTDDEATTAANEKAAKMREAFKAWVWTDTNRAADLVAAYNERYNNLAPRKFDGSHLTLPGVALRFKLHPHQLRAIWRQIQTGNTYLAHAVGAGKTIEMIAGGMEQKRLGLINKPMYVVPNHMLEQFANEFMELYPLANIMVADDKNFSSERRKAFVAAAALNAPDAIVITHDAFQRIGVKQETIDPIKDEILRDLEAELAEVARDNGQRVRRSQLEQQIEAVNQRFDSIVSAGKKDNTITFEELGVDFVYVDEAHQFRKLDFSTNQQIKGVDASGSRRALDLYIKTRWLESKRPGRSMIFASGTAVTNTMGELYSIMRFFAPQVLDEAGISTFDSWSRMFGEVAAALEPNAAGKYEMVTRFARFDNVPELMSRVRMFMDVLQSDQLGAIVKRPDIEGGKPELILVEPTKALTNYQESVLLPRLEKSRKWKPSKDEQFNPDPVIAIITDGRFAATDPRFIPGGKVLKGEQTKLDRAAEEIAREYKATAKLAYTDRSGAPMSINGGTQIVFFNIGFGASAASNRGFDARATFTKRMVELGVKRDHIAWFDDADSDAKKEAIFKGMRNGTYRVLIGSAKKMGTGVNVQNRLTALHYMDPPWYPADVEQPHGRIVRQGNQNGEVRIKWYATKGGYDSTMWQMVGRKQRFIDQAFTGDKSLRSMDDLGEASLYEQAAALASGDPRAIQLAGLKQDVDRFMRMQSAHASEQIKMRAELDRNQWDAKHYRQRIASYTKAQAALGNGYVTFSNARVGAVTYTKPGEFGDAVKRAFNASAAELLYVDAKPRQIGEISGAKVMVSPELDYTKVGSKTKAPTGRMHLTMDVGGYEVDVATAATLGDDTDSAGMVRRMVNRLNEIDRDLREAQQIVQELETNGARLRKKIGAPFEYQQDMLEKQKALTELEEQLRQEGLATPGAATSAPLRDAEVELTQEWQAATGAMTPLFSRAKPRITVERNSDGHPVFLGDGVRLVYPRETTRIEIIPMAGQRVLNYAIMPLDSNTLVGRVALVLDEDGTPISLLDIETKNKRGGYGRKVIETLLAANPDADLNISNIVEAARGFWAKMGVPEQFLEPGAAYDGTLNWKTFVQAGNAGAEGGAYARRAAPGGRGDAAAADRGEAARRAPQDQAGLSYAATERETAAVQALNDALVKYGLGQGWSAAYEPAAVSDAVSGIRQAFQAAFGRDVQPVAPTAARFDIFNGIYIPSQPGVVFVNTKAKPGFIQVAGHELWHDIRRARPELVEWFRSVARPYWRDTAAYRAKLDSLLQPGEKPYSADRAMGELEADFLGDSLADEKFLARLAEANPSKFRAFLTAVRMWLSRVANKLRGLGSEAYVTDVEALRDYLKDVLVAYANGKHIPTAPEMSHADMSRAGQTWFSALDKEVGKAGMNAALDNALQFTITQAMKDKAAGGMPLFARAPATDTADILFSRATGSVGAGKAARLESGMDGLRRDAELVANLLESEAFRLQGLRGLEAPAQREVLQAVLRFGQDLKVIRAVVELVPIDVVNNLARKNLSPESLFSDESVLKQFLSADLKGSVSAAVDVANALVRAVTGVTAKGVVVSPDGIGSLGGGLSAPGASEGDVFLSSQGGALRSLDANDYIKATGNRGTFDPESPDIRFSRDQELANTKARERADVAARQNRARAALGPGPGAAQRRPVQQQVRNTFADLMGSAGAKVSWWDKSLGTQYAKAEKHPGYKRVFNHVQQYLEDTSSLANEAADKASTILPKLDTWKDLKNFGINDADAKAIAGPIFTGTLIDKKVYTDGELRSQFRLTPEQIGQYRQFLAAVNTSLDQAVAADVVRTLGDLNPALRETVITDRAALRSGIDGFLARQIEEGVDVEKNTALREEIAAKYERIEQLKQEGYAPLMRFGEYKLHITDAEGQTLFFSLYESKAASNKAARELAEDPEFAGATFEQGTLSKEQYKLFAAVPMESLEMFADAIGASESAVFQEYIKIAKANRSAMKRLIRRKGTAGFSDDVPRVLAAFVTSNARMASGALNMPAAKMAATEIRDGDVQDEAVKLIDVVQNPRETAGAARALLFVNFIGGSIASAVVNLTQPVTMTLPYLSQWGGIAKSTARLMAAGKMAASGRAGDVLLAGALKRAERDGVVSPQEIHHLQAQAMGTWGTNPWLRKAAFIWASPFSLAEQFNRRVTFIAAFNTAREHGIDDPFSFAEKAVIETQGLYNKANAPNWARNPVGATALTFKQFSIHYLEWMGRMYRSGPEGKKAVAIALALLVLAAGTDGLPFADDLDDLIDTLGQALGYDMNSKRARRNFVANTLGLGDQAADVTARGASAMSGFPMDVSLRMSMGNLIPASGILLRSNTDRASSVLEVAGPAGGLAKQFLDAGQKALRGNVAGALEGVAPVALQNVSKAIGMWSTGEARDTLGRKVMDVDEVDGLMKFIGFNPQGVARESEKVQMIRRSEQLAKNVEGDIVGAWARGIVDQDQEAVQDARQKLQEWNLDNPEQPIRIGLRQIQQRVNNLRTTREQRFITSASPERRGAVREALQ